MPLHQTLTHLQTIDKQLANPEATIARWKDAVAGLYSLIRRNLAEYISKGLLTPREVLAVRTEERLGSYEIAELHLFAGPEEVVLSPIATVVVGALGRVDVYRRGYADNRRWLIWRRGKGGSAFDWAIVDPSRGHEMKMFGKSHFETILDELLKQA